MRRLMTTSGVSLVSVLRACVAAAFVMAATSASAQPAVAGGGSHALILTDGGMVWAVGSNGWGQLGIDSTAPSAIPVHVAGLSNVVAIAAGGTHSMALTAGGRVYLWGWNALGQLGDSSVSYYETTPQLLSLVGVTAIAAGKYHSLALTEAGQLYAWGGNPPAAGPQPVASFHTHVFNGGEPYPSGWIQGTPAPNDLTNAAARPDLVFFVRTPNQSNDPSGVFSIRYQAIEEEGVWSARNNLFKWNGVNWLPYSPQ